MYRESVVTLVNESNQQSRGGGGGAVQIDGAKVIEGLLKALGNRNVGSE